MSSAPLLAVSPQPTLYARIREELRALIVSGAYQPFDRVPSESTLMQQYGVSRITVRQALGELEKETLIFKVPGKGAFVSKPKPFQALGRLQGFGEAMAQLGHETSNRVLDLVHLPADATVAERLRQPLGQPVTRIRRVRLVERQPVSLDITYVPERIGRRLAQEDLAARDIFLILENDYGLALGHADLALEAVIAEATLAQELSLQAGSPVLRIERLTHTRDGQPLDFEYLYCRTDSFQYRMRIHRRA
ncbi:GntR family transcriptional regulator [Niveibacterium sp. SC-1]|uniref:GntR family transcriptional regulator n=1 Tax=Niveibacterium sp. SC-1 TaxID=3135646 RepID=UPI00311EA6AA